MGSPMMTREQAFDELFGAISRSKGAPREATHAALMALVIIQHVTADLASIAESLQTIASVAEDWRNR